MIRYRLSSSQRKDLLIRATPITIVIPSPWDELSDSESERFARDSLLDGRYVVRAFQTEIPVAPPGGDGLSGVLGQIHPRPRSITPDDLVLWVAVVCCHLDPPDTPRHPRLQRLQWPGTAIGVHGTWPRARGAGESHQS